MQPKDNIAKATTLAAARLARQAGISVIPIRSDGSKRPALASWKAYQQTPATDDDIDGWFESSGNGIGWVCGRVSGDLEVLDFDDRNTYQACRELAPSVGLGPLVKRIEAGCLKRFSNRPCTTWGGRGTSARTDAGGPMRAYSMDLRERALLDSDAGMKAADVAAKYRVSGSWVRLLKQRRRETGEVAPRVQRQGRRGMLEPHLHTLAALIAAHPDRTLAELKDALATPASVPTVWRAVRALGLTVTKNGPPVRTRSA